MKIIFIFSCSGMFRHLPECSVFRVLSTPIPSKLSAIDIIQYMFVPQLVEYFIKLVTGDDFSLLILIMKKDKIKHKQDRFFSMK